MRTIISLFIVTTSIAFSLQAIAETTTTSEPAKKEAPTPATASDKSSGIEKATVKEIIAKPAESGLDQQLCVQK